MNRLAYPLSIAHLVKILKKEIDLDQLSGGQILRFTSAGFITESEPSQLKLMDGTGAATFDLDQSANDFSSNAVVRLHYLISKSLQIRVIFIEEIRCGEQLMVHFIDQVKVGQAHQHQSKTEPTGEFNNFFEGMGEMR